MNAAPRAPASREAIRASGSAGTDSRPPSPPLRGSAPPGSSLRCGVLIADGRSQNLNVAVAHSIFTQKWRTGGDPYPPLLEVPLFAHSDNHVGLQIADLTASTLIFPMAASAYGAPAASVYASPRYRAVRDNYGHRLRGLQHRYRDETGRWRGGLVVSDPVGKRSGALLFGR